MNPPMNLNPIRPLLLLTLLACVVAACGASEAPRTRAAVAVPSPVFESEGALLADTVTEDSPAGVFLQEYEPLCSTSSDCKGFGKCSGGKCGSCSTSSDCKGFGKCSGGKCGGCSTSSDCSSGKCSGGKCGGCSTSSDCKGNGKCSGGKCGSCSTSSDCRIGKCSSGKCGACSTSSDCKGGKCSSGRCTNYAG